MNILLLADVKNISQDTIAYVSTPGFCDFCVSLGNVSTECLNVLRSSLSCNLLCINGDKDVTSGNPAKLFNYKDKAMCCINYSKEYEYWNEQSIRHFDSIINCDIDILFTHHSPTKHVDMYGLPDKPDYIRQLVKLIKPKLNIHGHDCENTIGTMKTYMRPDVKIIGVTGVMLLELNSEYQIRKFISIE